MRSKLAGGRKNACYRLEMGRRASRRASSSERQDVGERPLLPPGDGLGEFRSPSSLAVDPRDGTLYVRGQGRIELFSPRGEPIGRRQISGSFSTSQPMVITNRGRLYTLQLANPAEAAWRTRVATQNMRRQFPGAPGHGAVRSILPSSVRFPFQARLAFLPP